MQPYIPVYGVGISVGLFLLAVFSATLHQVAEPHRLGWAVNQRKWLWACLHRSAQRHAQCRISHVAPLTTTPIPRLIGHQIPLSDSVVPANLTQQYRKAEEAYRRAATPDEELDCLQVMLRELPKHKGTDKLHADLKQKISRLKKDMAKSVKSKRTGLRIPRQGAGRVILLGAPNCGKSQFIATMTRAEPVVADYPFTTQRPTPAMMPFEDISIQLVDTPPVTADAFDPDLHGLIRGADLVLLFLDMGSDDGLSECWEVVSRFHDAKTRLGAATQLDEQDVGTSYTQTFLLLNKFDADDAELRHELFLESKTGADQQGFPPFRTFRTVSTDAAACQAVADAVFEALDVVRVYTKTPAAKEPDFEKPYTIGRGGTLAELAALVHKEFAENLKFARVWGSAVHDGTTVKGDYVIHDKDIVELHL